MSTQKITSSKRKLDSYAATRDLDKAAKALAAREHIPMVEAYALAMGAHPLQAKAIAAEDTRVMDGRSR